MLLFIQITPSTRRASKAPNSTWVTDLAASCIMQHPISYLAHLLGTLQNFETRLLFSSAQVEYIRYWLHAIGLTKNLISLPYSDCLLTESSLRHVTPVTFKAKEELKSALKVCCQCAVRIGASLLIARTLSKLRRTTSASREQIRC